VVGWVIRGVELPFGDRRDTWWVDDTGSVGHTEILGAEALPGSYLFSGLVDAHAHPAVAGSPSGPVARDRSGISATLLEWARSGVTLVRDMGSPGGVTLDVSLTAGHPTVLAAGRFLAPPNRYFPELLVQPVEEEHLVAAAVAEIGRGATWVKVIGDFPRVPEFTDPARTYSTAVIAELVRAVHAAGGRVAVHSNLPGVIDLVAAGVDSIEHGAALDHATVDHMAVKGTAWTPTCCALFALSEEPDLPPERRQKIEDAKERLAVLLPYADARGVPILAGTDGGGSMSQEISLLTQLGLEPVQALAAASDTARTFLGFQPATANIVTYAHDPRDDPAILDSPTAVVVNGTRLR
jgi:imidazolonepropionase-like amidohydrolase